MGLAISSAAALEAAAARVTDRQEQEGKGCRQERQAIHFEGKRRRCKRRKEVSQSLPSLSIPSLSLSHADGGRREAETRKESVDPFSLSVIRNRGASVSADNVITDKRTSEGGESARDGERLLKSSGNGGRERRLCDSRVGEREARRQRLTCCDAVCEVIAVDGSRKSRDEDSWNGGAVEDVDGVT